MNMHATALAAAAPAPSPLALPADGPGALAARAMLADLSISMFGNSKRDKAATEHVNKRAGARDAARVNKWLVSPEAVAPVRQAAAAARATHDAMTLPWATDGARILPAAAHGAYTDRMRAHREGFESAARDFLAAYGEHVAAARRHLGDLFNESDYPSESKLSRRFGFSVVILPVPTVDDWRVEIADATVSRLRADLEATLTEATAAAIRDVYRRIAETVGRMAERLAEYRPASPDGPAAGIFRDSLVTNVRDLADMLPALNVTGDPALAAMADRIRDLSRIDPADLRTDAAARAATQREAAAIAATVADFLA